MRITELTGQRPASSDLNIIPMLIRLFRSYLRSTMDNVVIIDPPRKPTVFSLSLQIGRAHV